MTSWTEEEWNRIELAIDKSEYKYRPEFVLWLLKNKNVWDAFDKYTRDAMKIKHRKRFGARAVMEIVRWFSAIKDDYPMFKINNNYTPDLARLLMALEPSLKGFYEIRNSTERNAGVFKQIA